MSPIDVTQVRAETPGCFEVLHLNNAGASLPPEPVHRAVLDHLRLECRVGGYEAADRARDKLVVGRRPVPEDLLAKAQEAILPPSDPPTPPADLLAATRSMYDSTGTALILQRQRQDMEGEDA